MQTQAQVVIICGGIMGVSLAYHLSQIGWTDIVLLEKRDIASGSTAHAAGLVTQFHPSPSMMKIRKLSIELYRQITRRSAMPQAGVRLVAFGSLRARHK